jgi:hypothetical protein
VTDPSRFGRREALLLLLEDDSRVPERVRQWLRTGPSERDIDLYIEAFIATHVGYASYYSPAASN